MGQSIKLDNDTYWDSSGIVNAGSRTLENILAYTPEIVTIAAGSTGWTFKVAQKVDVSQARVTFIVVCGHQSGGGRGRIAVCTPNNDGHKITSIAVDWYQPSSVSGTYNSSFDASTGRMTISANNAPWATCEVIYHPHYLTVSA